MVPLLKDPVEALVILGTLAVSVVATAYFDKKYQRNLKQAIPLVAFLGNGLGYFLAEVVKAVFDTAPEWNLLNSSITFFLSILGAAILIYIYVIKGHPVRGKRDVIH